MTPKQQFKKWYGEARRFLQDGSECESTWIGGRLVLLSVTRRQFGTGNFGRSLHSSSRVTKVRYIGSNIVAPTVRAAKARRHRDKEYRRQTLNILRTFDFDERKLP